MVKVEAIIHPFKLDEIKAALTELGIEGVTILNVLDHSGSAGPKTHYRGSEYYADVPKVKLEMVVSSRHAEDVIEVISQATQSSLPDNGGVILVYELAEAIRIRNGRRMELARY